MEQLIQLIDEAHPLIQLLDKVHPLKPRLKMYLRKKIKKRKFKKGETIVAAGEVSSVILYIETGLIRSYSVEKGERVSNYFMREGDIIISVVSFFMRVPATDSIEALEDCVCWGITWEELEATYEKFIAFNINGRKICQSYYARSEARWETERRKDSKEKYRWLLENEPGLLLRVDIQHIASYLNVSLKTFYRMRQSASGRKKKTPKKTVK